MSVQFDFRQSGTASRFFQLQASSTGGSGTFTNVSGGTASFSAPPSPNTATSFSNTGLYSNNAGSGSQTFVQKLTYTFADGSVFENNSTFAFRFVSVFDPAGTSYVGSNGTYAIAGTARFDMVTVSTPVPEPATVLALAAGGLGLVRLARRRRLCGGVVNRSG